MNVLVIGGMVNVINKKVEEVWDMDICSLYKVVIIDVEVWKEDKLDSLYVFEVKGVEIFYCEGDVFYCKLIIYGMDLYLKFFWFDSNGGVLFYFNSYELNILLKVGKEYVIFFSNVVDYCMEKQYGKESEKINMMMVVIKEDILFIKEVIYQNVLEWVYFILVVQCCVFYDMVLIKQ